MSSDFDPQKEDKAMERLKHDRRLQRAVSALVQNAKVLESAGLSPEMVLAIPQLYLKHVKIRRP